MIPLLTGSVTYSLAIARMIKFRSTSGTSATGLALSAVSCLQWALWASWSGFSLMAWVNIAYLVALILPEAVTMAVIRPMHWRLWWLIPAWVCVNACLALVSLTDGPDLLGVSVSASGLLWLSPALRELFASSDLAGVSLWSWAISGVSSLGWGLYGLTTGAWAAWAYSSVALTGIVVAVARILTVRSRLRLQT